MQNINSSQTRFYSFLFFLFSFYFVACKHDFGVSPDSEIFQINIADVFYGDNTVYALFSNQDGEELFLKKINLPSSSMGGFPISFYKEKEDEVTVTFIEERDLNFGEKFFIITSYENVANNNTLKTLFIANNAIIPVHSETLAIHLSDIHSIEDIQFFTPFNRLGFNYEIIDNEAVINLPHTSFAHVYFIIKANGEDEYRYFYNQIGANENISYNELPTGLNAHEITLPFKSDWWGRISAYDEVNETPFWIFNRSSFPDEIDKLNLYLPNNLNLTEFYIDLQSSRSDFHEINHIESELPSSISYSPPEITISEQSEFENIIYDVNGEHDFQIVELFYEDKDTLSNFSFVYSWKIYRPKGSVGSYSPPKINDQIIMELSSLSRLHEPDYMTIELFQFHCPQPNVSWSDNPRKFSSPSWLIGNCAYSTSVSKEF